MMIVEKNDKRKTETKNRKIFSLSFCLLQLLSSSIADVIFSQSVRSESRNEQSRTREREPKNNVIKNDKKTLSRCNQISTHKLARGYIGF